MSKRGKARPSCIHFGLRASDFIRGFELRHSSFSFHPGFHLRPISVATERCSVDSFPGGSPMRWCLTLFASLIVCSSVRAADWPQWRGPNLNGSSTETGLPDSLDPGSTLAWSTPCGSVCGFAGHRRREAVYHTIDANKKLVALCLDENTGRFSGRSPSPTASSPTNGTNLASPSPITDGRKRLVLFRHRRSRRV